MPAQKTAYRSQYERLEMLPRHLPGTAQALLPMLAAIWMHISEIASVEEIEGGAYPWAP